MQAAKTLPAMCLVAAAACLLLACGGGGPIPEAKASQPRPLTVVIGDSITAGYIPTAGALQLRQDLSYTADLPGDVVTAAVGGASTSAALSGQVEWLRGIPADVVVILLGTNDAAQGVDRQQALTNVRRIAQAWPRARLVIVSPPRWDQSLDSWLGPWSTDLRAFAEESGARFVDLYAASRSDWFCHPTDHHPCANAHREIGALIRSSVQGVLANG
ncbi:SGNH/GDSL hydrolase family protein [Pelomonas sp. V22]|uniref:SGNH/GDSL hydrolase family protein n=1 Tax=Pelomonas sp. V22 TaxID=2822139 RepID=UPI0024A856F4|nr:SGNH/GDSL hydrolase family protein [Pelomonas sp. V22]MDI4633283.1 SGNH/GDSL hydrolase family protein [Pelomonas sp. V22]